MAKATSISLIEKFCRWLASWMPGITINLPDPKDNIKKPYLSRYYFFLKDRKYFNIFLHHFRSSDLEVGAGGFGILHSHPFRWSFSLVLVAGYSEERFMPNGEVVRRQIKPWRINFITKDNFHRVDLNNGEAWTLFFTGSRNKNNDWYFYDRVTKALKHWTESENAIP